MRKFKSIPNFQPTVFCTRSSVAVFSIGVYFPIIALALRTSMMCTKHQKLNELKIASISEQPPNILSINFTFTR